MAHVDANQVIHDLLQNIATEQKFTNYDLKVNPISTGGANYTSHLFLATITEGKRELDIFAKVAAIGEKMRAQVPIKIYETERIFYTKLAKVYRELEEKNNVPNGHRFKIPEFYGFCDRLYEETIVLENLTTKGYQMYDRFKSVDWNYAATSITELAKYHALSVAYQVNYPEESEKILADLQFELPEQEDEMQPFWDNVWQRTLEATREENKDRLKKFFEKGYLDRTTFLKFLNPVKITVIGHGDYRPSNLMHRVGKDGTIEVITVDYQTLRGGSPVVDLIYFIFTGTDAQFRAQHYQQLVDHYYEQLRAALTRLGINPDEKFSRADFDFELKEKLPFGLSVAVFTLPIVTVEAENAPKVDESLELSDFSIQKTGSLFPERLNGVVDDFVRWGII